MDFTIIMALIIGSVTLVAIWHIVGTFVTPIHTTDNIKTYILVTAKEECPELEQTINGLLWLVQNGTISAEIIIIDSQMDKQTRQTAETLARCESKVHVAEMGEIGKWIRT